MNDKSQRPVSIEVHIFHHGDASDSQKLDQILTRLGAIQAQEAIMAATLDDTLAAVTAESTVDDSIITLLNGLAAQIKAGGLSAADAAKVQAIFDQATANSTKIAAAVTANTPPAPPAPTP